MRPFRSSEPNVSAGDLKALRALPEEEKLCWCLCVCLEPRRRRLAGVDVLPYAAFLEALWSAGSTPRA